MFARRSPLFAKERLIGSNEISDSMSKGEASDLIEMSSGKRVNISGVVEEIMERLDRIMEMCSDGNGEISENSSYESDIIMM